MKTRETFNLKLIFAISLLAFLFACAGGGIKSVEDWNKKERGALIGGAGGAAVGAAVGSQSGNAGAGALIGGASGAAAGGLIGNELDKDDEEQRYDERYEYRRGRYTDDDYRDDRYY